MGVSKTSDHIQIKIKMPKSSQEPPASSKVPNQDLKDMAVLCTFKIKIERQDSEYGCTKDQWPYPNNYQDAKLQSGTSSVLQSPKSGLKGHGCSLHLQNQDREPKFGSWVCQRPVTIFKSRSRCQTPAESRPQPDPTRPDHPRLTYLNWFETYWGLVSELSLIWAWSKLQGRSKQGFWLYPCQDQDA